jgi:hypothetical protein
MAESGELSQAQRDQILKQIAGNLSIIKDELVLRRVREDARTLAEQEVADQEERSREQSLLVKTINWGITPEQLEKLKRGEDIDAPQQSWVDRVKGWMNK